MSSCEHHNTACRLTEGLDENIMFGICDSENNAR
jgi:hypothetical protein